MNPERQRGFLAVSELYADRQIALLTQHGKETAIAFVLDAALGCRVERVTGYDTDLLGTFTRDIPRAGTQLEAARRKARIGMELAGLSLGLASEGSFGPDPMMGMFAWNVELLIWIDAERGLEVAGAAQGKTNFAHVLAASWQEAEAFARQAGFPGHFLVVRPEGENDPRIRKGIAERVELKAAFAWALEQSASRRVFLETDGARGRPAVRGLRRAHARDPRRDPRLPQVRAPRHARAHRQRVRRRGALRLLQSLAG